MVEYVKMSDLVKLATIKAFGKTEEGIKDHKMNTPVIIKRFNSYDVKPVFVHCIIALHWKFEDATVIVGMNQDYKSLYVYAIDVKPEMRGKGIGTKYMYDILDHCDEMGLVCKLHAFPLEYSKDPLKFGLKKILPKYFRLKDWYENMGFDFQNDGYLVYTPQK